MKAKPAKVVSANENRIPDPLKPKSQELRRTIIEGYVSAMTMPFEVKDTNELAGLEAGDAVSFRMNVTDKKGWIDQLKKLDKPCNTNLPTAGPLAIGITRVDLSAPKSRKSMSLTRCEEIRWAKSCLYLSRNWPSIGPMNNPPF
jgi:hypothetical protein